VTRREWPFKGDSPLARSRKAALAYRQVAQDLNSVITELSDQIRSIDPRIIGWMDDEGFANLYKQIQEGTYPLDSPVGALDRRLYEWGESWHAEIKREAYDADEWINGEEAARVLGISSGTINRLRNRGRIDGKWVKHEGDQNGRWYYLAGDVYRLSSDVRPRVSRKQPETVNVEANSTGDPE
jgi:hypothetical protein